LGAPKQGKMGFNVAINENMTTHARSVARVLGVVFLLNIAVAAAKFFYGLASGSASMQADGLHSTIDSMGNIVGLIGIFLAGRPADESHPYGHSKFEIFASLVIGCLLVLTAFEVGSGAVEKLASGQYSARVDAISFVVMLGTLAVNIAVSTYERAVGKKLKSEVIVADSYHTLSDVFTSLGVIAGLVLVKLGFPMADPIMALVVTVFICISAVNVFKAALTTLSDHAQLPEAEIAQLAKQFPGIVEVHAVRSRGTESEIYCDLHLLVNPEMTVMNAHNLGDELEAAIKQKYANVVEVLVHIEPYECVPRVLAAANLNQ
jgi:cation diffusion facilitator family transporter